MRFDLNRLCDFIGGSRRGDLITLCTVSDRAHNFRSSYDLWSFGRRENKRKVYRPCSYFIFQETLCFDVLLCCKNRQVSKESTSLRFAFLISTFCEHKLNNWNQERLSLAVVVSATQFAISYVTSLLPFQFTSDSVPKIFSFTFIRDSCFVC